MIRQIGGWLAHAWEIRRTIRVRLTIWYVGLLAVILVAFSGFLYVNLARNLRADLDRSLLAEAQQIASQSDGQQGALALNGEFDPAATGIEAVVYDPTGTRLIDTDARQPILGILAPLARSARGVPTFNVVTLPDRSTWRVLTTSVVDHGRMAGIIQVARSQEQIALALQQLVLLMAIAIPATLLLAILGGLFLAGRALDPIDRITRTAERLGAEDLGRRLNMPGSDDEVGRLATTFDRMLDRLERAFRRQRQFTADASHELRTPLALLTSQLELALERSRSPEEYRQVLNSMRDDAQYMAHLLGDLLTLARADGDQELLAREPLDLNDIADDVITALAPLAEARGVALARTAREAAMVDGDQTRLTQLLLNLIENAIKYTPAGGRVRVATRSERGQAIIEVSDTGVGIAAEHLPHIFERFYRVDAGRARSEGGTGLGLAISQWIVRAHGGAITATSTPGQGTTLTVTLPQTVHQVPEPTLGSAALRPTGRPSRVRR